MRKVVPEGVGQDAHQQGTDNPPQAFERQEIKFSGEGRQAGAVGFRQQAQRGFF